MSEMTAFERQLSGEITGLMGPVRSVDDAAIFAVITADQSPGWGLHSIFSATKFVLTGGIVALFGGILLAGVLTPPDSERVAPAAVSPSPTAGLLSTLDAEEVRPGVYRILGDGHRDLRTSVWDVAVSGAGDVWVDRRVDSASRVARLGSEPEYQLSADDVGRIGTELWVDRDGSIRAASERPSAEMTFDGETWVPAEERLARGGSGTGDAVEGDGFRASSACCPEGLEVVRQPGDEGEFAHLDLYSTDPGFRLTDSGGAVLVAASSDGTIWVSLSTPGGTLFKLARFDGRTFDVVETRGPSGPSGTGLDVSGQNVLTAIAEASDGTLWVQRWQRYDDVLYVWSWDGLGWTEYGPIETKAGAAWAEVWAGRGEYRHLGSGPQMGISFGQDGSIWFDGLVHFDGEDFTSLDAPVAAADAATVVSAISVAPEGTIWTVMVGGYGEGCETSNTCGTSAEGLYVITPEAVVATE